MKSHEIDMEIKTHGENKAYGVSFRKGKEKNKKYKGSEIDKQFGFKQLSKTLENNLEQAQKIEAQKAIENKTVPTVQKAIEKTIPGFREVKTITKAIEKVITPPEQEHSRGMEI